MGPPGLDPARQDQQTYPTREKQAYLVSRERDSAKEIGPRPLAVRAFWSSGDALPVRKVGAAAGRPPLFRWVAGDRAAADRAAVDHPGWARRQCSAISRPVQIHTRSRAVT